MRSLCTCVVGFVLLTGSGGGHLEITASGALGTAKLNVDNLGLGEGFLFIDQDQTHANTVNILRQGPGTKTMRIHVEDGITVSLTGTIRNAGTGADKGTFLACNATGSATGSGNITLRKGTVIGGSIRLVNVHPVGTVIAVF